MQTILIIGGGFSGTAVSIQLLRRDLPLRVVLVERADELGRGVAYGTDSPAHLLNVPAGRMGLFPEREDDFLSYLREQDPGLESGHFAPRSRYGEYLSARLQQAAGTARNARLEIVLGEASGLQLTGSGAVVRLADGRALYAGQVVLADGNTSPADPALPQQGVYASERYIRDPWQPGALERVRPDEPVLLIGTGLTMMDVALELARRGQRTPMLAVSRRGLLPQSHRSQHGAALDPVVLQELLPTGPLQLRRYLRRLRRRIAEAAQIGVDWRDVVSALRAHTPALWQSLDAAGRRRFLRHLQPWWEVHRHRAAPEVHEGITRLIQAGRLTVEAGRFETLRMLEAGRIHARWRRRGSKSVREMEVGTFINCTGPLSDLRRRDDPLTRSLLQQGLMASDPLGLGVMVDGEGALVDASGRASDRLFYIGPLLKARDWECTAVPELRVAAAQLAARLSGELEASQQHRPDLDHHHAQQNQATAAGRH